MACQCSKRLMFHCYCTVCCDNFRGELFMHVLVVTAARVVVLLPGWLWDSGSLSAQPTAVRAHSCVRETCVRRLHAAWGVTICRSILPFARGCRVGVWFGFVGAALLPAVGTCVVLAFRAVTAWCCFLRVTPGGGQQGSGTSTTLRAIKSRSRRHL